uniref:Uncharacterized protein n=1 Tax=Rhizophora mucronata TaxID=61149 RepID=A0A2P2P8F2_RHIMU
MYLLNRQHHRILSFLIKNATIITNPKKKKKAPLSPKLHSIKIIIGFVETK